MPKGEPFPTKVRPPFSLSVDSGGAMHLTCDHRGCHWVKPVPQWTTLDTLARLSKNHWHSA